MANGTQGGPGEGRPVAMVQIAVIPRGDGQMEIRVQSTLPDPLAALGLLELGKDEIKSQMKQSSQPQIVVAQGQVPRT